jgi:hypothetical protein
MGQGLYGFYGAAAAIAITFAPRAHERVTDAPQVWLLPRSMKKDAF